MSNNSKDSNSNSEETKSKLIQKMEFYARKFLNFLNQKGEILISDLKYTSFTLKNILQKNSIEDYFEGNSEEAKFFCERFSFYTILALINKDQSNTEEDRCAIDILLNYIKILFKFQKNEKFTNLFENIRYIFNNEGNKNKNLFLSPDQQNSSTDEIEENAEKFNENFCKNFLKSNDKWQLKLNTEIDILLPNNIQNIGKYIWVRGEIKSIENQKYKIKLYDEEIKFFNITNPKIKNGHNYTNDWDWRKNLKKFDLIDCYDREIWYPATILDIKYEKNGDFCKINYTVSFRIYLKNFPKDYNLVDYTNIFKDKETQRDKNNGMLYIGDSANSNEDIFYLSNRIQKFGTYTKIQKKNVNENNLKNINEMIIVNNKISSLDTEFIINDDIYYLESNNKKNYIIGKYEKFSYYQAYFLKNIADLNYYDIIIQILKNKPNIEEMLSIFQLLNFSFYYLHKEYIKKNYKIFETAIKNFINEIPTKNLRVINDKVITLLDITISLFNKINLLLEPCPFKNYYEFYIDIYLNILLKFIKSNSFDVKIIGIKFLKDIIIKCYYDLELEKKVVLLLQKNDIVSEIFGNNYHSEIISKSYEILVILLKWGKISNEEMELIWGCTQKGDLETKLNINKLLSLLVDNLNQNYKDMLMKNIMKSEDLKMDRSEIELVYNLAIQGTNELNMMSCCRCLFKSLLKKELNPINITIRDKLLGMMDKSDDYISHILDLCKNYIISDNNTGKVYKILIYILRKYIIENNDNEYIILRNHVKKFISNQNLIKLFEDNLRLYKKKIITDNNNNSNKSSKSIINLQIDNISHEENIEDRLILIPLLSKKIYPEYNFLPILKEILLTKPFMSPNDPEIFYCFMKKYLSMNNYKQNPNEKNILIELFKYLTNISNCENKSSKSEFDLFITLFFELNKDNIHYFINQDKYEINLITDIDNIYGLDKFFELLFFFEYDKNDLNSLLIKAINIIYKLYNSKNNVEKLFEKLNKKLFSKDSNINIKRCIEIYKLIITESEKNSSVIENSHQALLKNFIFKLKIPLPYYRNNKDMNDDDEPETIEIFFGNNRIMDIKEILVKNYSIPLKEINIYLSKDFINSKNNKEMENDLLLDDVYNTKTIEEILNLFTDEDDNKIDICSIKEKNILKFNYTQMQEESLIINEEINPKFKYILTCWYKFFSKENGKFMTPNDLKKFIFEIVDNNNIDNNIMTKINSKVSYILKNYDKDNKNYLSLDDFIQFYYESVYNKLNSVLSNLRKFGIRNDLNIKGTPYEMPYISQTKLPRYNLGNNFEFIQKLLKLYNDTKNTSVYELLFFISTNGEVYRSLLLNKDLENNNFKLENVLNDKSENYIELLYILIIIESFLQDIELNEINLKEMENINENYIKDALNKETCDENIKQIYTVLNDGKQIFFENPKIYGKIKNELSEIREKISFINQFILKGFYIKLILKIKNILKILSDNINNNEKINKIMLICVEKGLKLINIIFNVFDDKNENNDISNTKKKNIINIEYLNLSSLIKNSETEKYFKKINFTEFINNLTNYLMLIGKNEINNHNIGRYLTQISKNGFCTLINILITNQKLFDELISDKNCEKNLKNLLQYYLYLYQVNTNQEIKNFFINYLNNLVAKIKNENLNEIQNINFLLFLHNCNVSLMSDFLDKLLNDNNNETLLNGNIYIKFFNYFKNLYHLIKSLNENKEISFNEILQKIYDLLSLNLLNKNIKNNEIFVGLMKILLSSFELTPNINEILSEKKINDLTLIDIIINRIYLIKGNNSENNRTEDSDNNIFDINIKYIKLEDINNYNLSNNNLTFSNKIKEICNEYFYKVISQTKNLNNILPKFIQIIKYIQKNNKNNNESNEELKQSKKSLKHLNIKQCEHVGLKNLGCICYMNSILQQLYMVPTFRYSILSCDDQLSPHYVEGFRGNKYDDNLLHQLQRMYTFLTFSEREDFNPRQFCLAFKDFEGNSTNPMIQQDSQEFYNNFCDKLENSLKNTKYKHIINDIFIGRTCSSVICDVCHSISNKFEDFYNLTLEVKNIQNLQESLQKLIEPEKIDEFQCDNCKKKVSVSKIITLCDLPNVLIIHLKRFFMNYEMEQTEKINSKFEFPQILNLKQFCTELKISQFFPKKNNENKNYKNQNEEFYEKIEDYYEYYLKGVNVHLGNAEGGHYFSYIDTEREGIDNVLLNPNDTKNWLRFNDSHISKFNFEDIPNECFGGMKEIHNITFDTYPNAYLLIYERKKKSPIKNILSKNDPCIELNKNNLITFSKNDLNLIKKMYDINSNNAISPQELYKKIFYNKDNEEYFKYIPFYNLSKYIPKSYYIEVLNDNRRLKKNNQTSETVDYAHLKEYYQKLFDYINESYFDIITIKDSDIRNQLIDILFDNITKTIINKKNYSNKNNNNTDKDNINKNLKIIFEKIVTPFFIDKCKYLNELVRINSLIISDKHLLDAVIQDNTTILTENFIKLSEIIKKLFEAFNFIKNEEKDSEKSVICEGEISKIIKKIDNIIQNNSDILQNLNGDNTNISKFNEEDSSMNYILDIFLEIIKSDKINIKQLSCRENIFSRLFVIFEFQSVKCRKKIYEIILFIINNEELNNYTEKNYENAQSLFFKRDMKSLCNILFTEKYELFNIIFENLQKNCTDITTKFCTKILNKLYKIAITDNKIEQLLDSIILFLNMDDCSTIERITDLLGYPLFIPKEQIKINETDGTYSKFFDYSNKKQIFKYISPNHIDGENYCLLNLLFPYENEEKEKKILNNEQKKKYIKKLIELCVQENNYLLFRYIYLLPSLNIKYINLFDEIADILSLDNKTMNKLNDYINYINSSIKRNKQIIKNRINSYLLPNANLSMDEEIEIPTNIKEGQKIKGEFLTGMCPSILPNEIIKEKINLVIHDKGFQLFRIEYYTTLISYPEFNNNLVSNEIINNNENFNNFGEKVEFDFLEFNRMNEVDFIKKLSKEFDRLNKGENIFLVNKKFNNVEDYCLSCIKFILYNKNEEDYILNSDIKYKGDYSNFNFFHTNNCVDFIQSDNILDFMLIYRFSNKLPFINPNDLLISISPLVQNKNNELNK